MAAGGTVRAVGSANDGVSRRELLGAVASGAAAPATSLGDPVAVREGVPTLAGATGNELVGVDNVPPYPPPARQSMPKQEVGHPHRPHHPTCRRPRR
jgi:hypothetical protein